MQPNRKMKPMNVHANDEPANRAFSNQSPIFDAIDVQNSLIGWIRRRVRDEVLNHIKPGARILELNCGTGIDALFFAEKGFKVLATDYADGMLHELNRKVADLGLSNKVDTRKQSFNNLEELEGQFDYIFSNFGGLNCTDDLQNVISNFDRLLNPGGKFTLVIMPVVCPWELITVFKGYFKTAFRRLMKKGTLAHVEGGYFKCYYHNPSIITGYLGNNFKLLSLKGLSIVVPPPFIENFIEKHPKAFRRLEKIENAIWDKAPFNRWCDHYMITMEKTG